MTAFILLDVSALPYCLNPIQRINGHESGALESQFWAFFMSPRTCCEPCTETHPPLVHWRQTKVRIFTGSSNGSTSCGLNMESTAYRQQGSTMGWPTSPQSTWCDPGLAMTPEGLVARLLVRGSLPFSCFLVEHPVMNRC